MLVWIQNSRSLCLTLKLTSDLSLMREKLSRFWAWSARIIAVLTALSLYLELAQLCICAHARASSSECLTCNNQAKRKRQAVLTDGLPCDEPMNVEHIHHLIIMLL